MELSTTKTIVIFISHIHVGCLSKCSNVWIIGEEFASKIIKIFFVWMLDPPFLVLESLLSNDERMKDGWILCLRSTLSLKRLDNTNTRNRGSNKKWTHHYPFISQCSNNVIWKFQRLPAAMTFFLTFPLV